MSEARWEHFPHGADLGVRGFGKSIEEAFEQAAIALTAAVTDPHSVRESVLVEIECSAPDVELLLVEWLNAVIYEMATRRMLFGKFTVRIDGDQVAGKGWGETIDERRHELSVEVKGATCTELSVRQDEAGWWLAQCVVDV